MAASTKTIKTRAKIIVIITVKNTGMQNALNSQITSTKIMNTKLYKIFPLFKDILKKSSLDVRFSKIKGNYTKYSKNT